MVILGLSGGIDLEFEHTFFTNDNLSHDSAATILIDGKIEVAIEEERLNRIKHTDKMPLNAIRYCLNETGLKLEDIDKIAVFGTEDFLNFQLRQLYFESDRKEDFIDVKTRIIESLSNAFDYKISGDKIVFCNHHMAHALSTFCLSGFEDSLILTIDGIGDNISGMILEGDKEEVKVLGKISSDKSLGWFYLDVINYLGFSEFEEYKVMGLAPYGDPDKYWNLFSKFFQLLPKGDYIIHTDIIHALLPMMGSPRKKSDAILQSHKDIAASLQLALEKIILHIAKNYQEKTQKKNLCLAGGVAHNCSCNGKLLYSGIFENIFVQPASHDAGTSIGSALYAYYKGNNRLVKNKLEHVYWGSDISNEEETIKTLTHWQEYIHFSKHDYIEAKTAKLIEEGNVIGWVQGRSEFGPRALGNRSILADPRPSGNKDRINEMVKKREGFRPFAPSVLEESVDEYFLIPTENKSYPFMVFVVKVKEDKQKLLGAITHVDGTARIQTVSEKSNKKYWKLIKEFGMLTGVDMLLNTSFNNNVEPIVESITDAIVCFLTTHINYLVINDYLIEKKDLQIKDYLKLVPSFYKYTYLEKTKGYITNNNISVTYKIKKNYRQNDSVEISETVYELIEGIDGKKSFLEILHEKDLDEKTVLDEIGKQIFHLWQLRYIKLSPLS